MRKRTGTLGSQGGDSGRFVFADVDSGLRHVSDQALDQLTHLLFLPKQVKGRHSREWLVDQERQMKRLDARLLRPKSLIERLAISMGKHRTPFSPERANLCLTHKPLDPRVVRKLMKLIADECTMQVDRFRKYRMRRDVAPAVRCWLERMDSATALWLGKNLFEERLRREARTEGPTSERNRCEACIMAVVGSNHQLLMDLRASLVARRVYVRQETGEDKEPRLLRAVDSWIRVYAVSAARVIKEQSETLVPGIMQLRRDVRRWTQQRHEKYRATGQASRLRPRRPTELTNEGLPVPRWPRARWKGASDSQSTFLSTAACTATERIGMVGRRRKSRAALRDGERSQGVDPRAWLDGVEQGLRGETGEEEKSVTRCEGRSSPLRRLPRPADDVSELSLGAANSPTSSRPVSDLSTAQPCRIPGPAPGPSAFRPHDPALSQRSPYDSLAAAPQAISLDDEASTYSLDSYYFHVAGAADDNSPPDTPMAGLHHDAPHTRPSTTGSDGLSRVPSVTTTELMSRRMGALLVRADDAVERCVPQPRPPRVETSRWLRDAGDGHVSVKAQGRTHVDALGGTGVLAKRRRCA